MEAALLAAEGDAVEGSVDYRGRPVSRGSKLGRWRSAWFIIGVEIAERFAYCGISSNLITYLTGPLAQPTATAAANINAWAGAASMLPLLGAFLADSYLGRYRTILFASLLYVLALAMLTLSAILFPQVSATYSCKHSDNGIASSPCTSPPALQVIFFFSSLYLAAIAQGGHKPCVQAFGADQFDGTDPEESKSRSSFFNWWYFGVCFGAAIAFSVLSYVQDNLSWGLGFGIPCVSMVVALVIFLLGTRTYRYSFVEHKSNPFLRVAQVVVAAVTNWRATPSPAMKLEDATRRTLHLSSREQQFNFLDKASADVSCDADCSRKGWKACSTSQVEEARALLHLVPIWTTCLMFAVVFAQSSTFFVKQGSTMDRSMGPNFKVPAASLQTFIDISIMLFLPIYDCVFVPIARLITGKPSGITMLQRIGIGIFFSLIAMVVAALVETLRLQAASDSRLVDISTVTIPMSVWWLVPQYVLFGIADVFTMVGLQEFFYDQVPDGLKSLGLALYLSILGVGNFLSSFLISIVEKTTSGNERDSWFSSNLNFAHLDYFYWLLAILSTIGLASYVYFAKSYVYNRKIQRHGD